jgi:twitching motility protein PilT
MSTAPIERIIKAAVERGASDIHIKAGDLFRARIDGRLVPLTKQRLTPSQTRAIAAKLLPTDEDRERLDRLTDFDCSWGLPGSGRFRVSLLRQRSSFMVVMRVIPFSVPSLADLSLPEVLAGLAEAERGLVLVAGSAGSGTTSTIAAMIHHLNQTLERHVVTVEDPIEFLHRDLKCSVTQREVGIDTASAQIGLRAALRHDPDVIVVGDIRDGPTIETAVEAALRGTLVIGAIHAPDAEGALAQAIALLPADDRDIAQQRLAEALHAVVAQRLHARQGGEGRIPAVEVLMATPEVRALVVEPDRLDELDAIIAAGRRQGMRTFAQDLERLVEDGLVAAEAPAQEPAGERTGKRRRRR